MSIEITDIVSGFRCTKVYYVKDGQGFIAYLDEDMTELSEYSDNFQNAVRDYN